MGKSRRFFAGSNSNQGFFSFFENIFLADFSQVYFLKGGPGTGKSSFMRKIADSPEAKNYDQELFFCSSDPKALDAVCFPQLGIALLDATAPHALEPSLPGCRDRIISLQDFWSAQILRENKTEIIKGNQLKQIHFGAAFRYFRAALAIEENIAARNQEKRQYSHKLIGEVIELLYTARQEHLGKFRKLFASALTPEGYVSHITNLVEGYSRLFILRGTFGLGQEEYLAKIADFARTTGYDLELYFYPLDPSRLLHILIPELKLAILSDLPSENLAKLKGVNIQCGFCQITDDREDQKLWQELLNLGFKSLLQAQMSHSRVENIYAQAMDFDKLSLYREKILREIFYENRS